MQVDRLSHITLATGDSVLHRLDLIDPRAVDALRALLPKGGQIPAMSAYRAEIALPDLFTIYRGQEPLLSCGLGLGSDRTTTWDQLVALQDKFGGAKVRQVPRGPWLAVVLLPPLIAMPRADLDKLADLERCMAAMLFSEGLPR